MWPVAVRKRPLLTHREVDEYDVLTSVGPRTLICHEPKKDFKEVCVCVCVCVYTKIHTRTHTHSLSHTHIHTCQHREFQFDFVCVLQNVFSCSRMCSLTLECVLLLQVQTCQHHEFQFDFVLDETASTAQVYQQVNIGV